ncbi:hypothetical protein RBI22_15180 [Alcaligenaceae bacterium C4P045]|nr:hypothetical protein [Alcaligenaceae bacterium C4P045]
MKLRILLPGSDLETEFPRVLPLFERLPATPEYEPRLLLDLARRGLAQIGVISGENGEPVVALAMELIYYPRITALNIIAMAGVGLAEAVRCCMPSVQEFAKAAGADRIEALCGDAMARALDRHGFKKQYNQLVFEV